MFNLLIYLQRGGVFFSDPVDCIMAYPHTYSSRSAWWNTVRQRKLYTIADIRAMTFAACVSLPLKSLTNTANFFELQFYTSILFHFGILIVSLNSFIFSEAAHVWNPVYFEIEISVFALFNGADGMSGIKTSVKLGKYSSPFIPTYLNSYSLLIIPSLKSRRSHITKNYLKNFLIWKMIVNFATRFGSRQRD